MIFQLIALKSYRNTDSNTTEALLHLTQGLF